ncbi:hypothetical protein GUJ93_ZPchr0012g18921 [Zizania palustris]|uniref:Uncharacterized protein n=1 Tax=Zizania palustris TaxID=103762 RepID=A0A8J5WLS5_ZIZPA|nr:hypothetical protein GUJ93_ZPchr0012g18921 [Zizania palustris]
MPSDDTPRLQAPHHRNLQVPPPARPICHHERRRQEPWLRVSAIAPPPPATPLLLLSLSRHPQPPLSYLSHRFTGHP